jgi:hypothetical protein
MAKEMKKKEEQRKEATPKNGPNMEKEREERRKRNREV